MKFLQGGYTAYVAGVDSAAGWIKDMGIWYDHLLVHASRFEKVLNAGGGCGGDVDCYDVEGGGEEDGRHLDDWSPLRPVPGNTGARSYVNTHVVERVWRNSLISRIESTILSCSPMSLRLQVSGKAQVDLMHEQYVPIIALFVFQVQRLMEHCSIIEYSNQHEGIEWMTMGGKIAKGSIEGRYPCFTVERGVGL